MGDSIVDLIKSDHRKIEVLAQKLKEAEYIEGDSTTRVDVGLLFTELKAMVKSHAKAEETALYSLFTDADEEDERELKEFSLEGFEEHQLIDRLLGEMDELEFGDDQWSAKMRVVSEILQHHLREEEKEFLPKVKDALEQEELEDLGALYMQQQQELFKLEASANGHAINVDIESLRN